MSTKDTLENLARNTWLAGLGSINSSKEALGKSIDLAQEKSNKLYNELVTRGEEIEAKGKKFLGMDSDQSHDEKLAQLNATVDKLTTVVASLVEKHSAPAAKVAKTTPKAEPKGASATKPAETAVKATKPITEATPNKAK